MVFTFIETNIDRAKGFKNDANMTGVYRMYSNMMTKVVTLSYGHRWPVAELKTFRREVCEFQHNIVNKF